ncbi:MAG: efflux RND transporter periplasmic adaptor subunit [Planctomycetes bacterium]|nr:efflux RND transporter periplasmic adaptor subunit [Planctomycetota bacterium]
MKQVIQRFSGALRLGLMVFVALGAMVLLMVWLAGGFTRKIAPREPGAPPLPPADLPVTTVTATRVPVVREVTGSIAAQHEIHVASQLLGRVTAVHASAGQRVTQGQVLVELEEAELRSRLQQAEALLRQAVDRLERTEKQVQGKTLSEAELVRARTEEEAARARVDEAQTVLAKTRILAPADGVLIERLCEVGDTVTPGQAVARLYDRLQLIATVPESLLTRLSVGDEVAVQVDALGKGACAGQIDEIVPQAQALSRAFQVKVTGPCPAGLIPGMFGRMRIPLGAREELHVPTTAIRRVGQVPTVFRVLPDGSLLRQFVQLGEAGADTVVVTSGLEVGDRVVTDAARVTPAGERP